MTTVLESPPIVSSLSATSLQMYLDCSLAFKFKRVDHIEFEHTSDSLLLGSAIHKTIEDYYLAKKANQSLNLEDLQLRFEEHWKHALEDEPTVFYKEGKNAESCLKEGLDLIATFHQEVPSEEYQVLDTEMSFSMKIEGLPVPVIGVIDLLLLDQSGTVIIVDHKTSSKAYSTDQVEKSLQMTLYFMYLRQQGYQEHEILLRFDVLTKTKKPKFEQYYTTRTIEEEKRLVKKIRHIWMGIEQGIFIPNDGSWKCDYCQFQQHCRQWFQEEGEA